MPGSEAVAIRFVETTKHYGEVVGLCSGCSRGSPRRWPSGS